jgi:hypothetical protein
MLSTPSTLPTPSLYQRVNGSLPPTQGLRQAWFSPVSTASLALSPLAGNAQTAPLQWVKRLWQQFINLFTASGANATEPPKVPPAQEQHAHHAHGEEESCGNPECPVHGSAHLD